MTGEQLTLEQSTGSKETKEERLLRCFTYYLDARQKAWTKAEIIMARFKWTERFCRKLASISEGQIMSGNKGYILTKHCSPEDFAQCNGRLRSQARKMLRRAIQQQRVYHNYGKKDA